MIRFMFGIFFFWRGIKTTLFSSVLAANNSSPPQNRRNHRRRHSPTPPATVDLPDAKSTVSLSASDSSTKRGNRSEKDTDLNGRQPPAVLSDSGADEPRANPGQPLTVTQSNDIPQTIVTGATANPSKSKWDDD
jgi:hypothetical protein